MNILNYLQINERLSTSGQPGADDFAAMAAAGFRTVINLAVPESDGAIAQEGAIVAGHGMNYFHIPVQWEAPAAEQFETFCRLMDGQGHEKTWVHCAANMRVSCFLYLYHVRTGSMTESDARALMNRIWNPGQFPAWKRFIEEVRGKSGFT